MHFFIMQKIILQCKLKYVRAIDLTIILRSLHFISIPNLFVSSYFFSRQKKEVEDEWEYKSASNDTRLGVNIIRGVSQIS